MSPHQFPGGPLLLFPEQGPQDIKNLSTKKTYSLLLTARNIDNLAYHRWTKQIQDRDEWNRICKRAYVTTRVTKLQSLQFKTLHAIIRCRKYLLQIRIVEDDFSPKCGEIDDMNHFFFLCPLVQSFWKSIVHWLVNNANINLEYISSKEAVLGVDDQSSKGRIANFILLHFRFYIHQQRLFHDNQFELLHWLAELRLRLRCRKANLQHENKGGLFKDFYEFLRIQTSLFTT